MQCSNNLKQIGLAIHNYHSAYDSMPSTMAGTSRTTGYTHPDGSTQGSVSRASNRMYLSFLVPILPFIEQQPLWEEVSNPSLNGNNPPYPPMGACPWQSDYEAWRTEVSTYRCPSDPAINQQGQVARANYASCHGDAINFVNWGGKSEWDFYSNDRGNGQSTLGWVVTRAKAANRGLFWSGHYLQFKVCKDGLSTTVMGGEIGTDTDELDAIGRLVHNIPINGNSAPANSPARCREVVDPQNPAKIPSCDR